jgi:hypothetical protein
MLRSKHSPLYRAGFALPLLIAAHATQARADAPVSVRHHCAEIAVGYAGTYIGGSTGENHYPYADSAVDLRADYRYCGVHHLEIGAGSDFYLASNWHAFAPALLLRGYLGPATRVDEIGLHARGGVAVIALPYGSDLAGQAVQFVPPLAHDQLLVGPYFSGGLDVRHWIGPPVGIEASVDLVLAPTNHAAVNGEGGLLALALSVGAVVGW